MLSCNGTEKIFPSRKRDPFRSSFGGGPDGGGRGKRTRPEAFAPGRGYAIYW